MTVYIPLVYSMVTQGLWTVVSMEDTESSDYLSSCDSVYSLDSTSSVEDDYDDFDVFLSDGCDEDEKDAHKVNERQGDDGDMKRLSLSPESQRTAFMKSNMKCLDHKYRALRTAGLHPMGFLQSSRPCTRYPFLLQNRTTSSSHSWAFDRNANVHKRTHEQKRAEGELKLSVLPLMEKDRPDHSITLEAPGLKRPREQDDEDRLRRAELNRRGADSAMSDGDRIFAEKCKELQGFIKPLTELLNGLKRGRFERGLSSFQQSVAMDRIQRIVGVLQKPEMGERYLGTLLQVEMMLKVWFPHVVMKSPSSPEYVDEEPECKLRNVENSNDNETKVKSTQRTKRFIRSLKSPHRLSPSQKCTRKIPTVSAPTEIQCEPTDPHWESTPLRADWPKMNLTWMHTSPSPKPPSSPVELKGLNTPFGQNLLSPNLNNCGFIVLLHNNLVTSPTYPRSAPLSPEISRTEFCHPKEQLVQTGDPPRSRSAPGVASVTSAGLVKVDRDLSRTEPLFPTSTKRPGNMSPWTWNLVTKVKENVLYSS
ncbi:circadian-associated transcriptional repressor isoform X2 [Lissotriton helveticus]